MLSILWDLFNGIFKFHKQAVNITKNPRDLTFLQCLSVLETTRSQKWVLDSLIQNWCIYDGNTDCFLVNIRDPACVAILTAKSPMLQTALLPVPSLGPHGLDIDEKSGLVFVECDDRTLVELNTKNRETDDRGRIKTILMRKPSKGGQGERGRNNDIYYISRDNQEGLFSSDETVPERAKVSLRLTNRRII
jgi:hypothetical protein